MTTKERLHALVDALDEADADRLLDAALALTTTGPAAASGKPLPAFVASIRSGSSDTSDRAEEILRAELGGRAAS
jgi:ribosomal protein L12E/L44/L45/RPP1/RPP2